MSTNSCEAVTGNNDGLESIVDTPLFIDFCQRAVLDTFRQRDRNSNGVRDLGLQVPAWISSARSLITDAPEASPERFLKDSPLFSDDLRVLYALNTFILGQMQPD